MFRRQRELNCQRRNEDRESETGRSSEDMEIVQEAGLNQSRRGRNRSKCNVINQLTKQHAPLHNKYRARHELHRCVSPPTQLGGIGVHLGAPPDWNCCFAGEDCQLLISSALPKTVAQQLPLTQADVSPRFPIWLLAHDQHGSLFFDYHYPAQFCKLFPVPTPDSLCRRGALVPFVASNTLFRPDANRPSPRPPVSFINPSR